MFCYGPLVSELWGARVHAAPNPVIGGLCPPAPPPMVMISEYDLSFGYEYKLFESLNPVCQPPGKISSLHGCSCRI